MKGMVFERNAPHGLTEERVRTRRQACAICGLQLVQHDLKQARVCAKELERQAPMYCRLTGPSDPKAFLSAAQRKR